MLSKLNNKPYTLHTTLEPNQIYSCFGIKIKVKEQVDTFSNKGNFSIHINNINLKALKSQSHNTITKDTPLFCPRIKSNSYCKITRFYHKHKHTVKQQATKRFKR